MISATLHGEGGTLTRAALAPSFRPFLPGPFRRASVVAGDLLGAIALVLCIPFVILLVATPIVLCVSLLMWLAQLL